MGSGLSLFLLIVCTLVVLLIILDGIRRLKDRFKVKPKAKKISKPTPLQAVYIQEADPLFCETNIKDNRIEPTLEEENMDILDEYQDYNETVIDDKGEKNFDEKIISLYVMARKSIEFDGPNLLQALHAAGLRIGEMNIFHKYEHETGTSMFSVASAVEPGIFNLETMGSYTTPGLIFFLKINEQEDIVKTYDLMIETADSIAERLAGEVLDEHREPLSAEYIEENRNMLNDYIRAGQVEI